MIIRDIGGGRGIMVSGASDAAALQIAAFMQTNGITTDAAKRAALNTQATLLALVKLFLSDAIQIVDMTTLKADS